MNGYRTYIGFIPKKEYNKIKSMTEEQLIDHVRSMRIEWTHLSPFNLEKGDEITNSWKYEYAIFELVKIYKTFDWKRNVMIYYGY